MEAIATSQLKSTQVIIEYTQRELSCDIVFQYLLEEFVMTKF